MTKGEIARDWCLRRVGCPYIYGATGKKCAPSYRQARAAQYPAYAAKIQANCPRLSGKASACKDCKWCDPETGEGKPAYDCAQFSRWCMDAVGISLVSGSNSQWEKTAWAGRGTLDSLPADRLCLVFRNDGTASAPRMGHVGVYLGDGAVAHAKGHAYGVVREQIESTKFTHWGVPVGLYEGGEVVNYPTLRRGDAGEYVTLLQILLTTAGYGDIVGSADGKFGAKTQAAVKAFQTHQGLTADGVCGIKTWAALNAAAGNHSEIPNDPDDEPGGGDNGFHALDNGDGDFPAGDLNSGLPAGVWMTDTQLRELRACLTDALGIVENALKGGAVG